MPFKYRLQKILDFRIRKKEEQLLVVQKAQQAVFIAEENIRKNNEEIRSTQVNMRQADPMMYDTYDKFLIHLGEKAEQLEQVRVDAQRQLDVEVQRLIALEQAVKVLEKHKEKNKEAYIEEEKKAELKGYSELGVQRFFRQSQERLEEEDKEILKQIEQLEGRVQNEY